MEWMALLIPIVGIVFGLGIVLMAIWTEHKRDMALIEKGLYQISKTYLRGQTALLWGLILTWVGVALIIGSVKQYSDLLLPGLLTEAVGIALLIYAGIVKREKPAE